MPPSASLVQPALWPLSLIVFLPAAVAAFLSLPIIPKAREELIRWITLGTLAVVFVLSLWLAVPQLFGATGPAQFQIGQPEMQSVVKLPWIKSFGI
jgi:NADH:ubiquinone oxidoreductase subunit 4 (subunit M)